MNGVNQQVVEELEGHFEQKALNWSQQVKMKGGWVCKTPGCGEIDKDLLESHHIKPVYLFPELQYDLDNGECLCLWCHAFAHQDNMIVCNKILARLGVKLYYRLYPNKGTPSWKPTKTDFQMAKDALNGTS